MSSTNKNKLNIRILSVVLATILFAITTFLLFNFNKYEAQEIKYNKSDFSVKDYIFNKNGDFEIVISDNTENQLPKLPSDKLDANLSVDQLDKVIKYFGVSASCIDEATGLPKADSNIEIYIEIQGKEIPLSEWLNKDSENFANKQIKEGKLGSKSFYYVIKPTNTETFIDGKNEPLKIEVKYKTKLSFERSYNIYYQSKQIWFNEEKQIWEYKIFLAKLNENDKTKIISTYYSGKDIPIGFIYSKEYLIRKSELKKDATDKEYYDLINYSEEEKTFKANINKVLNKKSIIDSSGKEINFGKEAHSLNEGKYEGKAYTLSTREADTKDLKNSAISLIIERQPILFVFSNYENQLKFIKIAKEINNKTDEEINNILARENILKQSQLTLKKNYEFDPLKEEELSQYSNIEQDEYNYFKYMLKLEAKKEKNTLLFSSNMKELDKFILTLIQKDDSKYNVGKIYTSFENVNPILYGLNSEKVNVELRTIDKNIYDTTNNSNSFKNSIEYKKTISAKEYILSVLLPNNNFILVNDKLEAIKGDKTDGKNNEVIFSEKPKTQGYNFKLLYTIKKAEVPKIDFPQFNAKTAPYFYNGQEIELKPNIHGDNSNIKYTITFFKEANNGYVRIGPLSPKNAGKYKFELRIIDENYNLKDVSKTILNGNDQIINILPITYQVKVDVSLSTQIVDGKPTPTTMVNISLPHDLSIDETQTKFSIDGGEYTSNIKKLENLPTGRHTITIYSESPNFVRNQNGDTARIEKIINVPDKREIPMLGAIIGGIIPTIAPFDLMILFIATALLSIIAIIMILVAIPKLLNAKKKIDKPLKDKKIKKHDDYYDEKINKKFQDKKDKKDKKYKKISEKENNKK